VQQVGIAAQTFATHPAESHPDFSFAPFVHGAWAHVPTPGVKQHTLASQYPPASPHELPHMPQLAGSDVVSVQFDVQQVIAVHVVVQLPQWLSSLVKSKHPPVHADRPASSQSMTHLPASQSHEPAWSPASPWAHTLPHVPQFRRSFDVFAHVPLQSSPPLGHLHAPLTHVAPIAHTCPHVPQFCGSVSTLTVCPSHIPENTSGDASGVMDASIISCVDEHA
jgi:hypothetical protein